jgi:hypothetical protein
MVSVQFPAPEHVPLHPENFHPAAAVEESVTCVPAPNVAEQLCGQSIPAGADVTEPEPEGATVRVKLCGAGGPILGVGSAGFPPQQSRPAHSAANQPARSIIGSRLATVTKVVSGFRGEEHHRGTEAPARPAGQPYRAPAQAAASRSLHKRWIASA